jgi:uncharacterized RDD family membrane protein YckC
VASAPSVRGDRASVPRRLGAFLIDVLILIAGSIVVTIFFGERSMEMVFIDGQAYLVQNANLNGWQIRWVLLGWFAYLIGAEACFRATLGKRIFGITVVHTDWSPVSLRGAVLRQITHLVPVVALASPGLGITRGQALVYAAGAIFAMLSEDRQRLGDRLASTMVVRFTAKERSL